VESSSADAGVGLVFFFLAMVWVFGGFALWIWAIVDVVRQPEHAYRMAGREKSNWVLVVVLVQLLGALIWVFSGARKEVRAAAAANPYGPPVFGPPPGWYPDPSGRPGKAWWDGRGWSGHRQDSPPDPPVGT
jgi:hypothetical protein